MVCIKCELMQSFGLGKLITILISTTSKAKSIFSKGTSNSKQIPTDGCLALNAKLYEDQNSETVSKWNDSGREYIQCQFSFRTRE